MLLISCILWMLSPGLYAGTVGSSHTPEWSADGPYLLHRPDGSIRFIRVDARGTLTDTIYTQLPPLFAFQVTDHRGHYPFSVQLHPVSRPACRHTTPDKTFVLSDPHGRLDCLVSLLQGNGVINSDLHWSYGTNHLMVIGDLFDRGKDVIAICWLLYQLEAEATRAGGHVSVLLGNHEPMILANDLRYAKKKYPQLADRLHLAYADLLGPDTELGRWLATRNTLQIIGSDLYVHAGLSSEFYRRRLTLEQVNEAMSKVLFLPSKTRKNHDELSAFLYGSRGPIWYRGLVRTDAKYAPMPSDTLQLLLKHYGVNRIIVGHTIFKQPRTFYRGRVIGINVNNRENQQKKRSRALLITRQCYYTVGDEGIMKTLRVVR